MELLAEERWVEIVKLVQERKIIKIDELCALFNVSKRTIWRDLKRLEADGLLRRTYGGARAMTERDLPFSIREDKYLDEKIRICNLASSLINDGDTVIIDAGTTTIHLAKAIRNKNSITVMTNSIGVVSELSGAEGITVVVTGGTLRNATLSLVGRRAEDAFKGINADVAFIATAGFTIEHGFTNSNLFESEVKKAMISAAREVVVLADYSKFGRTDFTSFAGISQANKLITDRNAPPDMVERLRKAGIDVLIAD